MKLIVLLFLFMFAANEPQLIKGRGFTGYIFPATHVVYPFNSGSENRFTPSNTDIFFIEKVIAANIKSMSSFSPEIHKKLHKYTRQYVGFINDKGQRVVWVNFIWSKSGFIDMINKDILTVSDGGTHYWNIKMNLDTKELYEFHVNGLG